MNFLLVFHLNSSAFPVQLPWFFSTLKGMLFAFLSNEWGMVYWNIFPSLVNIIFIRLNLVQFDLKAGTHNTCNCHLCAHVDFNYNGQLKKLSFIKSFRNFKKEIFIIGQGFCLRQQQFITYTKIVFLKMKIPKQYICILIQYIVSVIL